MFKEFFGGKAEAPEEEGVVKNEEIVLETEAGDDVDKLPDDTEDSSSEVKDQVLEDQLDDESGNPNISNPENENKNVFVGDVEEANKMAENLSLEEEDETKAA